MSNTRSLFWVGLVAVGLAAAWVLLVFLPSFRDVRYEARDPWAVGNTEDAFAYAGEGVVAIRGTANLRLDPSSAKGTLEFDLLPDEALTALIDGEMPERSIVLHMHTDEVWSDQTIHGHSEVGDSRLPETHMLYVGSGRLELLLDGKRQPNGWQGFWSIGDALRQDDGSIRDQGLVFSPLLRDQSGFSDPNRLEITLLLYESPDSTAVVLHLVFPDALSVEP